MATEGAKAPSTAPTGAAPPPPGPPPPPAPSHPSSGADDSATRSALFAQINRGEGITSGKWQQQVGGEGGGAREVAYRTGFLLLSLTIPAFRKQTPQNKRASGLSVRLAAKSSPEAIHKDKGSPSELVFSASSVRCRQRLIASWGGEGELFGCMPFSSTKGVISHLFISAQNLPFLCVIWLTYSRQMWNKSKVLGSRLFPAAEQNSEGLLVLQYILISIYIRLYIIYIYNQCFWLPLSLAFHLCLGFSLGPTSGTTYILKKCYHVDH